MLLIVASRYDHAAASLAARWQSDGAVLLTPAGLSHPGWRFELPAPGKSRFALDGQTRSSTEISGVLTRLPAVHESELNHIAPEDRPYVAAEMTAFLLAWISSLGCPVLNRPAPGCLCGPNWGLEQWIHRAAALGIPVEPVRRTASGAGTEDRNGGIAATVVGDCCVTAPDATLAAYAQRLAVSASVELLQAQFDSAARLRNVSLCPDVSAPEIGDAMLEYFRSRSGSS